MFTFRPAVVAPRLRSRLRRCLSYVGGGAISRNDQNLFEPASGPRHNLRASQPWINGFTWIDCGSGSFHPKRAAHDAMGALAAQVIPALTR